MHPVLFEIPLFGGLTIYTYGVLVAAGFTAGIFWIVYDSKRLGLDPGRGLDLVFYIIIAAILGSRIFYLIVNDPSRIYKEPWSIFMVWEGGLVFYGGLIGAVLVSVFYLWRRKISFLLYADLFAPAIALGHAFGRMGCFMAGCCHGRAVPEDAWYAVIFPSDPHTFAPSGVPLYPTQLIESVGELLIFFSLVLFRKYKKFDGHVFALYLMLYSILRFGTEFLRGDADRGYIIQNVLSSSQGVSLVLFTCGIALMAWGYSKVRRQNG